MDHSEANDPSKSLLISLFTWMVVLLVSDLPNAIWQAIGGEPPAWLFWVKIGLLGILIITSVFVKPIRIVRPYFFLLLVLMLAYWGMNWLRGTDAYLQWEQGAGWVMAMAAFQLLKLSVAAIMVIVLLLMGRKRKDFFLTPGELGTPITSKNSAKKSSRQPISWTTLGLILGVCIAPLTLIFFAMENLPTSATLLKALPYFPLALLFAITNAFSEEVQFRASLLGDLQKAIGPDQAIWLTAAYFGLWHYFGGSPSGIPGVIITGLLGALFAKCMLGSRGIVVPWFIHFCQNAVIYAFWAIGAVS